MGSGTHIGGTPGRRPTLLLPGASGDGPELGSRPRRGAARGPDPMYCRGSERVAQKTAGPVELAKPRSPVGSPPANPDLRTHLPVV